MQQARSGLLPEMQPPAQFGGYAIPREPIRVVLASDEEAVGIESAATKLSPPAYGLWRESVVRTCLIFLPTYLPTWGKKIP